jgi:hypothetical protein
MAAFWGQWLRQIAGQGWLDLISLAVARAQLGPAVEARIDTLLMNDQRALPLERGR